MSYQSMFCLFVLQRLTTYQVEEASLLEFRYVLGEIDLQMDCMKVITVRCEEFL